MKSEILIVESAPRKGRWGFIFSKGGWGAFFLLILLLASCGTKKQAIDTTGNKETRQASLQHIVETVNANRQDETYATARMNLSLTSAGGKSVSIGGMLRMKRNDVIQLSFVTFGILEVARIEITPDYFMGIDKMGKQYVKAAFGDVSFFKNAGIDFYTLQSLFWDELFVLGAGKSAPSEIASGLIRQTTVSPHAEGASPYLTWKYEDFGSLAGKNFPTSHTLTISGSKKPITANLFLSNLKNDSNWETRTEISRSYKEISVEQLLSRLMKL